MIEVNIPPVEVIKHADTARGIAQDWQANFADQDYSYEDLANWGDYFEQLAQKFPELREEFQENGII